MQSKARAVNVQEVRFPVVHILGGEYRVGLGTGALQSWRLDRTARSSMCVCCITQYTQKLIMHAGSSGLELLRGGGGEQCANESLSYIGSLPLTGKVLHAFQRSGNPEARSSASWERMFQDLEPFRFSFVLQRGTIGQKHPIQPIRANLRLGGYAVSCGRLVGRHV